MRILQVAVHYACPALFCQTSVLKHVLFVRTACLAQINAYFVMLHNAHYAQQVIMSPFRIHGSVNLVKIIVLHAMEVTGIVQFVEKISMFLMICNLASLVKITVRNVLILQVSAYYVKISIFYHLTVNHALLVSRNAYYAIMLLEYVHHVQMALILVILSVFHAKENVTVATTKLVNV